MHGVCPCLFKASVRLDNLLPKDFIWQKMSKVSGFSYEG